MIYFFLVYNYKIGTSLIDAQIREIKEDDLMIFASFFSALNSFIKCLILDGNKKINLIELGDYLIRFIPIFPKMHLDLIMVYDKAEQHFSESVIPLIFNKIQEKKEIFVKWDSSSLSEFKPLEDEIVKIVTEKMGSTSRFHN